MRLLTVVVTVMCVTVIPSACDCPATCECKWKYGKESVLCEGRNLTNVPSNIDSGTQLLDMSNNNLTAIQQDQFASAQLVNLQKVFLSRCSLRTLHRHAFHNLINLVDLDLSYNLLSTVPSHTFDSIPLLTELKLNGNPIPVVRNNSFKHVPHLNKLDLSECRITYLESNAFAGLENSLEWLKLSKNRFTNVRGESLMILRNLKGLELAGNAWNCSCNLRPLREWVLSNNIPQTISPVCRHPDRLAAKLWDKLQLDDFACLPKVQTEDPVVAGYEGSNVTMSCIVKSLPLSGVKWLRRDKVIGNASGHAASAHFFNIYVWSSGSNLTITSAELTDSGEYTCRAENRAGRSETRINLSISVKPQHPSWSTRVVMVTAAIIVLFSLAAVLLLICVCCLWRKQQRFQRHVSATGAAADSYEMNHKIPNSYEKVVNYGNEVKIDEPKGHKRETRNGFIGSGADCEPYVVRSNKDEVSSDLWRVAPVKSPVRSAGVSPDLHIPAVTDLRYGSDTSGRSSFRLSPASEKMVTPGIKQHMLRKDYGLNTLYTSCHDSDNFPDLLETDKSTLPRRGYRPRRTRTGSFGSESMSPLLTGSSDESCDSTIPLPDFPDPYPELDKFLKEYRNLQEQLYKMKESCENLKQDNLRFKSEFGGEPKTISRLMDEVFNGGDVEPMYSVYSSCTSSADPYATESQAQMNGNVVVTPNNNPAPDNDDYWLTKGKLLNSLADPAANPTKSFYES